MSCKVTTNRHGVLTFRIYFEGREYWKSTGKRDTPGNREELEELAKIISRGTKNKTFSLEWFQEEENPRSRMIRQSAAIMRNGSSVRSRPS
jgi:hypothetical protein